VSFEDRQEGSDLLWAHGKLIFFSSCQTELFFIFFSVSRVAPIGGACTGSAFS